MKNFVIRIVFVGITVPILFALALFVPWMDHAPLALVVLVFTVGASFELRNIMEPAGGPLRIVISAVLSAAPPLTVYVVRIAGIGSNLAESWLAPLAAVMVAGFLISAIPLAFPGKLDSIPASVGNASSNSFYLLYPGALSSAIIVILGAPDGAGSLVVWFALIVFGNDSLAWLAGVTLGRKRGIFPVSPKKSLEGLLAGMTGSIAAALLGPIIFPEVIPGNWPVLALLGLASGACVVAGDLFESALKRSASVKDSGSIVPGRGGMLDSFDSLLFTAPVFATFAAFMGLLG
jgi:phosphatidate cytidylyltransferase